MDEHVQELLMRQAIAVCEQGMAVGQSPFGAVIADQAGTVIAAAHNSVRLRCDPTAHAEIDVIRQAAERFNRIHLTGHVLFTTCEPCAMCAAAIHWARLDAVYYGASIQDAVDAGFNELPFPCAALLAGGGSSVELHGPVLADECSALFGKWRERSDAVPY
ncbi:MAG: nucleoside deaminase [Phycisphaerales bacterium]|nr:MAG: nucleoside deaminase [Phycisphaerales bacterium]